MQAHAWDEVFRRTTREQRPDAELRRRCASGIPAEATRLDAVYRLQMETLSSARAEEAALLGTLVQGVRPALPALASPLLLRDARAPKRPALVHLRALLPFGAMPAGLARGCAKGTECLFLLDDATFLRVRFTGATSPTDVGRPAFSADRLEGVEARGVLRDHGVAEVAEVLRRVIAAQTSRRRAHVRDAQVQLERLRSLRVLLGR
jgi:hypothetical protein